MDQIGEGHPGAFAGNRGNAETNWNESARADEEGLHGLHRGLHRLASGVGQEQDELDANQS